MSGLSGLFLLSAAQTAAGQGFLSELPGPGWPGVTAAASNASWPSGHQPARLEAWPKTTEGLPAPCWKTTVVFDKANGWPGKCLNLFRVPEVGLAENCRMACWGDPRCAVWQFVNQTIPGQCWIGAGIQCDNRGNFVSSINVQGAQRLMHGEVRVLKSMVGVKVKNLFELGEYREGTQDLSIMRCKAWCYSIISCDFWQFSASKGCFIDAPMLSTQKGAFPQNVVSYPLTAADVTQDPDIIAGEYVQHYCPSQFEAPTGKISTRDIFYKPLSTDSESGVNWAAWIFGTLIVLLAIGAAAYYFLILRGSKRSVTRKASADEDPLMDPDEVFKAAPKYNNPGSGSYSQNPQSALPAQKPQGGIQMAARGSYPNTQAMANMPTQAYIPNGPYGQMPPQAQNRFPQPPGGRLM
jgi:hypothetical protein